MKTIGLSVHGIYQQVKQKVYLFLSSHVFITFCVGIQLKTFLHENYSDMILGSIHTYQ